MKVKLVKSNSYYDKLSYSFMIVINDDFILSTSCEIAKNLNLSTETFTLILIEKIIQHNNVSFERNANGTVYNIAFKLNGVSKEIYVERFKKFFVKELILLSF